MSYARRTASAALATLFALGLFLLTTAPAQGQSKSAQNSASLTVVSSLTLTPTQDLTWTDQNSGVGLIANDQGALVDVTTEPLNSLEISVTVPDSLTNGNSSAIPLQYGAASGYVNFCDSDNDGTAEAQTFDPTAATPQVASCVMEDDGNGIVAIGSGSGVDPVEADIGPVPASTYTGTIDWTVTVQ